MRQLPISAFAALALLLAACQSTTNSVRVEIVPASPAQAAPAAPAAPEVAVETPTRLLPAYDEGGPAPATPVVAAEAAAPTAPMVAEPAPAPAAPMVAEEAAAPAAPMAEQAPAPAAPVVAEQAPVPAAPVAPVVPVVAAPTPKRPLPVEAPVRNGPIILAAGQSAQLGKGDALRFDSLESDSRCQPGVPCTWAGEVTLFFILQGESSTAGFELSSSTKAKTTANGRGFQLMAYGACPDGGAGECATVNVAPTP